MFPDANTASIVDRIGNRARHSTDAGFAETLYAIEPPRLQTIDINLRLLGDIHDGRKTVGEIAHAVMPRARKFAVPGNGVGCDLRALDEGADHIGLSNQGIDNQ